VSQPVSEIPLIIILNQVKGPDVGKHLEVGQQQVGECYVVVPVASVAQVSCLAVKL
jgi:hypothetical protein